MKAFFGILISLFAIYLAIHAIVWAILLCWGFGPAGWALIFLTPVFLMNAFDLTAAAAGDCQRRSDWKRRRQWRGY